MIRADLHVHSEASKRPSEWFLQKVGARESYTRIDTLYDTAKARGMDFVTVTDHNTIEGALELVEKYPGDTFISSEITTYFPENRCKIHVLVYDITPEQFEKIDALRHNIYSLREYIQTQGIAYSVAHGFYSINGKLDMEILEKLILLFDVFEGLNGARNRYYNESWQDILRNLTPLQIKTLSAKYGIKPMSSDAWIKGFTAGSDDHAGLFIAQTYTCSKCQPKLDAFINSIRDKHTTSQGRCNDYKSFAFSIYKIFCDYSATARKNAPGGILAFINEVVFEDKQSRLKRWVTLRKAKKGRKVKDKIILKFFEDVYNWSDMINAADTEAKMDGIYKSMGLLLDEFFKLLIDSFVNDLSKGDIGKLFRNLASALPAFFISVPFFSSLRHLSQDRDTIIELKHKYVGKGSINSKKILWFSDTLHDLNGVSVTLGKFRKEAVARNMNLTFVGCTNDQARLNANEPNLMYLPCIYSITPEFYHSYTLNFPSLLASIEMIYKYRPERIIVSTPGPVGMLGMLMAGILGIECVSIYHTDFGAQAGLIFGDEAVAGLIQSSLNRFYSFSSHIKVPTREYIRILEEQNYNSEKMSIFKRGFNVDPLQVSPAWIDNFKNRSGIKPGTTLLWAGRVSKDKNIQFLMDIYTQSLEKVPELNLIFCGDGPDLEYFKDKYRAYDRILFTGYLQTEELQTYYEFADIFVFPSTTDTFGMVILEAQACGLPALVTDVGGPQEIIEDGRTGHVLKLSDPISWVDRVMEIHTMRVKHPEKFMALKEECRDRIRQKYDWNDALSDIIGEPIIKEKNKDKRVAA